MADPYYHVQIIPVFNENVMVLRCPRRQGEHCSKLHDHYSLSNYLLYGIKGSKNVFAFTHCFRAHAVSFAARVDTHKTPIRFHNSFEGFSSRLPEGRYLDFSPLTNIDELTPLTLKLLSESIALTIRGCKRIGMEFPDDFYSIVKDYSGDNYFFCSPPYEPKSGLRFGLLKTALNCGLQNMTEFGIDRLIQADDEETSDMNLSPFDF